MKPIAFMDGLPSCKNTFCEIKHRVTVVCDINGPRSFSLVFVILQPLQPGTRQRHGASVTQRDGERWWWWCVMDGNSAVVVYIQWNFFVLFVLVRYRLPQSVKHAVNFLKWYISKCSHGYKSLTNDLVSYLTVAAAVSLKHMSLNFAIKQSNCHAVGDYMPLEF